MRTPQKLTAARVEEARQLDKKLRHKMGALKQLTAEVGRRRGGRAGRNRTCSPCPRRKRCQPPLGRRLQQPNERDGRS